MKFVMSYSCGKDSTLALHHMIKNGNEPVALIVMVNKEAERSYFHGADYKMLEAYSENLGIPILPTASNGEDYHIAMEESLRKAIEMGAEAACFGDIDIDNNRAWSEARCENVGIEAVFPLWQRNRADNVYEIVNSGYKCLIKSINNTLLPESFLGKCIDSQIIEEMKSFGIDICGENGEYHTLAIDGPIFKTPIEYKTGELIRLGDYSIIDVTLKTL